MHRYRMNIFTGISIFGLIIIRLNYGALLKGPVNTTARTGDYVSLSCTTDHSLPVSWYFGKVEIFYGGKVSAQYASMFRINSSEKGDYNLIIPFATLSHDGFYTCADDEGEGEKKSAWLYVEETLTSANPEPTDSSGITSTIIIVVVVAVVVIAITVIAVCFFKKCRKKRDTSGKRNSPLNMAHETNQNKRSGADAVKKKDNRKPLTTASSKESDTKNRLRQTRERSPNIKSEDETKTVKETVAHFEKLNQTDPVSEIQHRKKKADPIPCAPETKNVFKYGPKYGTEDEKMTLLRDTERVTEEAETEIMEVKDASTAQSERDKDADSNIQIEKESENVIEINEEENADADETNDGNNTYTSPGNEGESAGSNVPGLGKIEQDTP